MLLLFKPWTQPLDLLSGHNSFQTAFDSFLQTNDRWKLQLTNMQLLHECRDHCDDHFAERLCKPKASDSFEGIGNDANVSDDLI